LALGLIFSIIGFFLNLLVIYRIKKLKRKIKDQTRNVKINIILSSIFPLLLALSTLIIFVLTYSFSY
jgi:ABC-type lipoprotein release transport system permease subunit